MVGMEDILERLVKVETKMDNIESYVKNLTKTSSEIKENLSKITSHCDTTDVRIVQLFKNDESLQKRDEHINNKYERKVELINKKQAILSGVASLVAIIGVVLMKLLWK